MRSCGCFAKCENSTLKQKKKETEKNIRSSLRSHDVHRYKFWQIVFGRLKNEGKVKGFSHPGQIELSDLVRMWSKDPEGNKTKQKQNTWRVKSWTEKEVYPEYSQRCALPY